MWGLFAGEARKQPPHIPFSTAIPKDPIISGYTVGWAWRLQKRWIDKRKTDFVDYVKGYRRIMMMEGYRFE